MKKGMWVLLAVVALAVQAAGLGGLISLYEQVVTQGTEVRIPCEAFDPRDVLRGRYLHVSAALEWSALRPGAPETWRMSWRDQKKFYALLESPGEGGASHRVVQLAREPGPDGLWVKVPNCRGKWDEAGHWMGVPVRVGFPGKLFMDERLAPGADKAFAARGEGASAVAVYRAWKRKMVIMDVEIDGVSVKELAKRGDEPPAAL